MANDKEFRVRKGLVVANTVLVTSSNNVGIGTPNPTEKLTVNGAAIISDTLSISGGKALINSVGIFIPQGTVNSAYIVTSNVTTTSILTNSINTAFFSVSNTTAGLFVNSAGAYHTGVVNAASHTVGTSLVANSTGVYSTGIVNASTINAASHIVGSNFTANSTGVYHSGSINSSSVNTTSLNVSGLSALTNLTVSGTVGDLVSNGNIAANTINTASFNVNSTGTFSTGIVNGSSFTATNYIANSTGVYHSGVMNAATYYVGANINLSSAGLSLANGAVTTTVNSSSISTPSLSVGGTLTVTGNLNVSGNLVTTGTSQANGDLVPTTSLNYSLGNTTNRWLNILSSNTDLTTYLSVGNATINVAVTPTTVNASIVNSSVTSIATLQVNTSAGFVYLSNNTTNTQLIVPTVAQYNSGNVFLRANGSWGDVATVLGGTNTQIQFNDSGSVNATAGLTFNKSTNTLSISNAIVATGSVNALSYGASSNGLSLSNASLSLGNSTVNSIVNSSASLLLASIANSTVNSYTSVSSNTFNSSTSNSTVNVYTNVVSGVITLTSNVVGSNGVTISLANVVVGNSTVSTTVNSTSFSGTATNASNLNNQPGSYYTNATNITTGTLPDARHSSAIVNTSANFSLGGNITFTNANNLFTSSAAVGNAVTANIVISNTTVTFNTNTTSNGSISATNYSGTANNANNLGGIAAAAFIQNTYSGTLSGNLTLSGSALTLNSNTALNANGSNGISGQVLTSNGSAVYWATAAQSQKIYRRFANALAGQIDFIVPGGFTNNSIDVYYNGVHLSADDYTQNGASGTVSLNLGANAGAVVEVSGWTSLAGAVSSVDTTLKYTWSANQTFNSNIILSTTSAITLPINATANATLTSTNYSGTANNANNLAGIAASQYLYTNAQAYDSARLGTFFANQYLYTNAQAYDSARLGGTTYTSYLQLSDSKTLSGNLYFSGANNIFSQKLNIGDAAANVIFNPTTITFNINSTSSATITATNYSGTASNALLLNNQSQGYYTNATNIITGTLPDGRLSGAIVNTSANFNLGGVIRLSGTSANIDNIVYIGTSNTANLIITPANATIVFNGNTIASINALSYGGTAANATLLNNQNAAFYQNASNMNTGTLPDARLSGAIVNTSGTFTMGGSYTFSNPLTFGRLILTGSITAQSSNGIAGQALLSNGSGAVYWGSQTASAGGSDTYVQFNDGGATINGYSSFTYNKTTSTATLTNAISVPTITAPTSITINKPTTYSGANVIVNNSTLNLTNTSVVLGSGSGTAGYVLASNGATGSPNWSPFPSSGFIFGSTTITATVLAKGVTGVAATVAGITTNHKVLAVPQAASAQGTKFVAASAGAGSITFSFMNENTSGSTTDTITMTYLAWI